MSRLLLISLISASVASAQGLAVHVLFGPTLPAVCSPATGDVYFLTVGGAGVQGLYSCDATNTWVFHGSGSTSGITGSGTMNFLPVFSSSTIVTDSHISDNGSVISLTEGLNVGTPSTSCGSATSIICFNEASVAGTPTSGQDYIRSDSTSHGFVVSLNGATALPMPLVSGTVNDGHMATFIGNNIQDGGLPSGGRASLTSTQTLTSANSETIVLGYALSRAVSAGTSFRLTLRGVFTDASSVGPTSQFNVRYGSAGTTADTAIASVTTTPGTTGTNVAWRLITECTFRSTTQTACNSELATSGLTGIASNSSIIPLGQTITSGLTTTTPHFSVSYVTTVSSGTATSFSAAFGLIERDFQ